MGVVRVEPYLPMPGIPDAAVIEKVRRGMAGCGSCLGMGYTGTGEEFDPGQIPNTGGGGYWSGGGFLQDITRGGLAITAAALTPPTYRSVGPSGITEIRAGGGGVNYPYGQGPTALPISGISTTTVLLLGIGVLALFAMQRR